MYRAYITDSIKSVLDGLTSVGGGSEKMPRYLDMIYDKAAAIDERTEEEIKLRVSSALERLGGEN